MFPNREPPLRRTVNSILAQPTTPRPEQGCKVPRSAPSAAVTMESDRGDSAERGTAPPPTAAAVLAPSWTSTTSSASFSGAPSPTHNAPDTAGPAPPPPPTETTMSIDAEASAVAGVLAALAMPHSQLSDTDAAHATRLDTLASPALTRSATVSNASPTSTSLSATLPAPPRRSGATGVRRSVSAGSAGSGSSASSLTEHAVSGSSTTLLASTSSRSRRQQRDSTGAGGAGNKPTQWTITDESSLAAAHGHSGSGSAAAAASSASTGNTMTLALSSTPNAPPSSDAPPVPPQRMNKPRTFVFHPLTPSSMSQMLNYDTPPPSAPTRSNSGSSRHASPKPQSAPTASVGAAAATSGSSSPKVVPLPSFPQQVYLPAQAIPGQIASGQPAVQAILLPPTQGSDAPGQPQLSILGPDGTLLPATGIPILAAVAPPLPSPAGEGNLVPGEGTGDDSPRSATPPDGEGHTPLPMQIFQLPPGVPVMPGMVPVILPPGGQGPILLAAPPPAPPRSRSGSVSGEQATTPSPQVSPSTTDLRRQGSGHSRKGSGSTTTTGTVIDEAPGTPPSQTSGTAAPRRYSFVNVTSAVTAKLATEHGHEVGIHYKQKRKTITPAQLKELNAAFRKSDKPGTNDRDELARRLGMSSREVQVWFQNRRAKQRSLHQKKEIRPPQPLPVPGEEPDGRELGDAYPTPFGSPRIRRARSSLSSSYRFETESMEGEDEEMDEEEAGGDSGSSGLGSPIGFGNVSLAGDVDMISPPHTPPSAPFAALPSGEGGAQLPVSRGRSGVDLLAMVALQQTAPLNDAVGSSTPGTLPADRLMSRWATNTSDGSDLTRKCSTNSSAGSVTISTIDTRRYSIGSGIVDALEDIRLTEQLQDREDDDDGAKGLKRSWSARDPARTREDGDAMQGVDRREASPGRSNPLKRAQSTRHPLSQQYL